MPRVSRGTRTNRKLKPAEIPTAFEPGFIARLDGRTGLARALRDRFDSLAADLGGIEEMSGVRSSLLARFVWLEASLAKLENDMATAADPKATSEVLSRWIQGCNSLLGIAKTLGLDRKIRGSWDTLDY